MQYLAALVVAFLFFFLALSIFIFKAPYHALIAARMAFHAVLTPDRFNEAYRKWQSRKSKPS